uniref:Uncharacterized protein n=1 Tax=Triticum urartu TaxID=4572 RepID=A0A8R7Q3E6_TRIUA
MKKIKIDAIEDAIYQRYCCTNYRIKDPPEGEPFAAFIRIGGFDISFKHFSNGLKKHAHLNNEVMSLYIKSFNIEQTYNSTLSRRTTQPSQGSLRSHHMLLPSFVLIQVHSRQVPALEI